MSRGKSFQHKKKGHVPQPPKHGFQASSKHTEDIEYAIDTVGTEDKRPITIEVDDDSQ
ncbi:hypothetical protein [Bacillus sp. FJAT-47783]|uniref:hypothetical protein n=1 Tax=Bacillus sp. FJAT-47783 TaxID=2922712 RepID=UPI001FAC0DE4|nr:hypothetical protein [Bacillus sp. FJAT-47783]